MAITIVELLFYILRDLELSNGGRPLFPGSDVDDQLRKIYKYPFKKFSSPARWVLRCSCMHLAVVHVYIELDMNFE